MKRAIFTKENRQATRDRLKWQTRRIGDNPWKVEVGDVLALAEPVQIAGIFAVFKRVDVSYLDDGFRQWVNVSDKSLTKIQARKDPHHATIARHMLGDFARHYIRITDKRVEQLQDISEEDCYAEGVRIYEGERLCMPGESALDNAIYRAHFWALWNSINKQSGRAYKDNPVVTAYSYEFLGELNS
ncbi:MAG: hypothetical protein AAFY26_06140 [Cyanobacteria bacterium J06638_22]